MSSLSFLSDLFISIMGGFLPKERSFPVLYDGPLEPYTTQVPYLLTRFLSIRSLSAPLALLALMSVRLVLFSSTNREGQLLDMPGLRIEPQS